MLGSFSSFMDCATCLREKLPRLYIDEFPPSRSIARGEGKLEALVLRWSKRITRCCIQLGIHDSSSILHFHQPEMHADCFVLIEERGDLRFECSAAIHSRQIESAQHLVGAMPLQPLGYLAHEIRRRAFREGILRWEAVLRTGEGDQREHSNYRHRAGF